ncbi:MAG: chorismate mutase [Plesiomonas shigelloides]
MATLDEIRQDITLLDQAILALLAQRKDLSIEVARAKQANPRPIRDPKREQELLIALIEQGRELGLDAHYITDLYHTIIEDSVRSQQAYLQRQLNPAAQLPITPIACLGPQGSDSSLAAYAYQARHQTRLMQLHYQQVYEVLDAVAAGHAALGILPIENGQDGSIAPVYEQMRHTELAIVGELTHPNEPLYYQQAHHSRFIVVAREPILVAPQILANTSLLMAIGQPPSSRAAILQVLDAHAININKLGSCPQPGHLSQERIYLEVAAHLQSPAMQGALAELAPITDFIKVLGCYPNQTVIPTPVPAQFMQPQKPR